MKGRTIIVTGVSSGIGAGVARFLREQGVLVIGVDRQETALGSCDRFITCDLGQSQAIDTLVRALPEGIHGLCNIAGLPPTASPADVLRVNVSALERSLCNSSRS